MGQNTNYGNYLLIYSKPITTLYDEPKLILRECLHLRQLNVTLTLTLTKYRWRWTSIPLQCLRQHTCTCVCLEMASIFTFSGTSHGTFTLRIPERSLFFLHFQHDWSDVSYIYLSGKQCETDGEFWSLNDHQSDKKEIIKKMLMQLRNYCLIYQGNGPFRSGKQRHR